MNKLYSVHDHWTDINKKNDVDIESIDGVITGIKVNGEDFAGISWTQVFTGVVVASGEAAPFSGTIPAELSGADTIKVIYNDNVYILNKQTQREIYYYGATIGETPSDIDFSVYPFVIVQVNDSILSLYTQSPGPQALTIFELQSGGGESDFSTAEVTYRLTFEALEEEETGVRFRPPVAIANNEITIGSSFIPVGDIPQGSTSVDIKCSTPLYKNKTTALVAILAMATGTSNYVYQGGPITATGNATITDGAIANITGDCVITIPVELRN